MLSNSPLGGSSDSSLEYCFTNIFALTDFNGIQYRKYVLKTQREYKNLLEDPIIKSFSLCQKNSILSAWVRSKRNAEKCDPCSFSKFSKDLWVFWYGNGDLPNAGSCILPDLCEEEKGNWRQGLSYEIRTVLFRALHNVVEKCLLNKGFVRLGRWFVQPYKHNCSEDYTQYSISFSFFLHGESTVCASLDLRQHSLVRRVSLKHIQHCSSNQKPIPVILAPYGIAAELSGFESMHKSEDDFSKELEAWSSFYPLRCASDHDISDSPTGGLPSFITTSPTQGSRSQVHSRCKSPPDKRPHLNKSVPKDLDFIPPFVEVIVGGFRMRYPTCFVLLVDSDDDAASTGACPKSEYPPHAHVHSSSKQIPQPSCDIKQGINAELKCPHSWRIPKRKVLHLTRTRSIPGRYSTRSFECSLQSDLGFDVRRMHLGEVALSRSRRDRLIPSSFKLPTPCSDLAALSESNDSADAFCKGISVTCSAYSLSSRNSDPISCRCQRPCLPRQLLSYGPFHHIDADTRCALRGLISELNTVGDSSHNFSQHQAIGTVPHDPSMPTLSPQQPTSLSGPSTTSGPHWSCVSKSSTELLRGVANKGDLTVTASTSLVPTAPPSLSFSNPARISTIPHISNLASPTVGLPNGLVSVERPASPVSETSTSSSRPPTALLSITKPSLKSVWLTEQISMEAPKRPVLKLNLADECEEDQPCTTDLCPSTNAIKAQSAVFFASSDEYHSSDGCSRPKRLRISCTSNPSDQYDGEDTPERAKFCGMERGSFSSDTPPDSVGFDSCEDECTVPNDLLGYPLSSGGCNTNSLLNRTLGLMVHKGVSLASSTGSGHLGPAELALMLPTPPSHDAPQPSPGDVMAVGASTTGNTRTNLPGFATDVADSPTPPGIFLTHNLLDSCNTFDQSVAMTLQQPLSPPQTQLLNLAKQSCVQNYNFTTLDPIKDWSFVRPCAAYFGITGSYQFCRNDSSLFPKSIPHVQLAYDHRALRNYRSSICDPSLCADHMGSPSVGLVRSTSSPPRQIKCALTSPNGLSIHQFETNSVELKPSTLDSVVSTSSTGLLIPSAFDTEPATATSTTYFNHEGSQSHLPESDAILVNIMLSDSMLNLFRDHNFDSCNICECSSSVMGSEIDLYLVNCAPAAGSGKTQRPSLGSVGSGSAGGFGPHDLVNGSAFGCANECKCGFSAVMNQKYVVNGNLFYEDEVEVTSLFLPSEHMPDRPRVYSSPPVYNQKLGWWAGPCSPSHEHLMLLLRMMQTVYDELCVRQLMDTLRRLRSPSLLDSIKEDMIEYDDACTLVAAALSESCISHDSKSRDAGNVSNSRVAVNPSFLFKARSKIPENHNDQIRLLATMRPWLQEAISSTRLLESNYTVDGPLTWKAFHQLAGRGSEETCKPQPVPQLRVGSSDNEHLLISPFAIRDWDRLALSPLSLAKHLAYAVVIPGDPHELACTINPASNASTVKQEQNESKHCLLSRHSQEATSCRSFIPGDKHTIPSALVGFLKELSLTYENFRLGRHLPYYLPELNRPETAFITVHPLEDKLATPEEDNFGCFSPDSYRALVHLLEGHCTSPAAFLNCLQSYVSSACRQTISLFIERGVSIPVPITRGGKCTTSNDVGTKLFPKFGFQRLANSFKRDHDKENDPKIQTRQTQGRDGKILGHSSTDPHNGQGPLTSSMDTSHWGTAEDAYLVVYLLNPFFQFYDMNSELSRITMQAFLGCAQKILTLIPESWRPRVSIQLLSLEDVMSNYSSRLRSIALSIYSSVARYIEPSLLNANRTLTGIGPASEKEIISNEKEVFHKRCVNAPPYTLVASHDCSSKWDAPPSDSLYRSSVLFVAYCLSEDQQWLLASFTDEQGSLIDQALINIRVPSAFFTDLEAKRTRSSTDTGTPVRRFISPRRIGLTRLWDYIISLISGTANPWRLVIGRIGRLGHGELKGWNGLLGRKSLQDVNRFFRERCSVCNASTTVPSQAPGISGGNKTTLNLFNCSSGANSCTHELPSLISACLVSLEPQSTFRLYPGLGLSSDDMGGGGGGCGGVGGSNAGGGGGGGAANSSVGGIGNTLSGSSVSPYTMRTMIAADYPLSTDMPSSTHILVFPTSTSASGLSEHDATALDDVMMGMGFLDWLRTSNTELGDLDAPGNAAAAMFDAFDNPSGLEFNLAGLGAAVGAAGVHDHSGTVDANGACASLGDPVDNVLAHSDYVASLRYPRGHGRPTDVSLHGIDTSGLDLGGSMFSGLPNSQRSDRFTERLPQTPSGFFNTMPHELTDRPDEVANLMQQPLAMGYYISTAPTGPLPSWFWAACPHSSLQFPVCLKSALHLQMSLVGVDDAAAAAVGASAPPPSTGPGGVPNVASSDRPNHLLDSTSTCDVLRYVLEAYNALSWLTVNPVTSDRRSCLPVHMLILCQLYQAVESFT